MSDLEKYIEALNLEVIDELVDKIIEDVKEVSE